MYVSENAIFYGGDAATTTKTPRFAPEGNNLFSAAGRNMFRVRDRQLIVVAIGASAVPAELMALALP